MFRSPPVSIESRVSTVPGDVVPSVKLPAPRSIAAAALGPRRVTDSASFARNSSASAAGRSPASVTEPPLRSRRLEVLGADVPRSNASESPARISVRRDPVRSRVLPSAPAATSVSSPIEPVSAATASLAFNARSAPLSSATAASAADRTLATCTAPALRIDTLPALACTSLSVSPAFAAPNESISVRSRLPVPASASIESAAIVMAAMAWPALRVSVPAANTG